jgi:O-antigen biosynthesis protein
VLFFAREIFPLVRECLPDVVFEVIGPYPTPEISGLASESIHILGFVPDVKPLFDKARLSVAPLRFGAGVKGKVNQSMSLGVPTVVTSIAAEGMNLAHEVHSMIADEPKGFAQAVVRLWSSPDLWRKISKNGLLNLQEHFSVEAAAGPIDELLAWAGLPRASASIEQERGHERTRPRARIESGRGHGSTTAGIPS